MGDTILRMENIVKKYPGVVALDHVSFDLKRGEAHCLLGENGAGKSTLIKIISGAIRKDSGEIFLNDQPVEIDSAKTARELGICTIYQEFNLIPDMTVAENIFLGIEPTRMRGGSINRKEMRERASAVLADLNIDLPVDAVIRDLSVANMQMVEIAKALVLEKDIIIMDEPTASIGQSDTEILFGIIDRLKARGKSIIYISHRLQELSRIIDRVTVMRDGKKIQTLALADTSIPEMVRLMIGKELKRGAERNDRGISSRVLLEAKGYTNSFIHDVSFALHEGEILGFTGLLGAGRTEIMRAIFGADHIQSGELFKDGAKITVRSPSDAVRHKIGFVTEDRKQQGLILIHSVCENISLPNLRRYASPGRMDKRKERSECQDMIQRLRIMTPSMKQLCQNLSGGNQQKVVVAKWLRNDCDVIIFDEPTRGIDVGAKEEMYQIILDLARQGKGILLVSSELEEMARLANKVHIVRKGRIVDTLTGDEITQEALLMKTVREEA